ncbi:MAG: DUF4142 domain-containing protein [Ferruginibacter sp.]
MKKVEFVFLIAIFGLFQACNSGTNNDSVEAAKDANDKKDSPVMAGHNDSTMAVSNMPVDKDAADFAVEAANGGMMEVELGNYAQQNASSQRVKDFAVMMVKDHSKANGELKEIAVSKNITLPMNVGEKARKDMDDLMKKKGKDFDKAYMNMMLDDHKKDVKAFEKAAKDCNDPEIKSFAGRTLPVLQGHLDSSKALTGKK